MKSPQSELRFLSLSILIVYGFFWWIHWPGIFQFDVVNAMKMLANDNPFGWVSFSYSYIIMFFYHLYPHPFLPLGFTLLAHVGLYYFFFKYMLASGRLRLLHARLFCAVFCLWPYMFFNLLELDRAIFSALFFTALTIYFVIRSQTRKSFTRFQGLEAAILGMIVVATSEIRQDTLLLMAFFPAALWWRASYLKKEWIGYFIGAALTFYALFIFSDQRYMYPYEKKKYKITAIANPLSEIIFQNRETTTLSPDELERFGTYVDIPWLKQNNDFFDMWVFHADKFNHKNIEANWEDFSGLTSKLLFNNLDVFFANRWRIFIANMGAFHVHSLYNDVISRPEDPVNQFAPLYNIHRTPAQQARVDKVAAVYYNASQWRILRVLLFTLFPSLCMALVVLYFWKSAPIAAVATILVWQRYAVLALFSPAPLAKYVFPMVPATLYIVFFAWTEIKARKARQT